MAGIRSVWKPRSLRHLKRHTPKRLTHVSELSRPGYAQELRPKCFKAGLLVSAQQNSLVMFPSLTMEQAVAKEGLDRREACLLSGG